jgi:DME family drug/metabolite transporter
LVLALSRHQLHRRGWPLAATATAIGTLAGYQLFFFAAVARTGVTTGTVVAISSAPILAGLLDALLGVRLPRAWLWSTLLAVAGSLLLVGAGSAVVVDLPGILFALGAGGSYALYTLASKELLRHQPPDAVTAVAFCGGALVLSPFLFFVDLRWLQQPQGLLVALHLGLVATALAYMLYIRGLLTLPPAAAVTVALAEPLTAATLGVVLLGEQLTFSAWCGVGLIFAGLAVLARRSPPPLD